MLENVPSYLIFNNDIKVNPSDVGYSGSLIDGTFKFNTITAGSTVSISYSFTASDTLPSDVTELVNIATDNGVDPGTIDPEACDKNTEDCADTTNPITPETDAKPAGEVKEKAADSKKALIVVTGAESQILLVLYTLIFVVLITLKTKLSKL